MEFSSLANYCIAPTQEAHPTQEAFLLVKCCTEERDVTVFAGELSTSAAFASLQ